MGLKNMGKRGNVKFSEVGKKGKQIPVGTEPTYVTSRRKETLLVTVCTLSKLGIYEVF